jgi:hypothetical protein
MPGDTQFDRRLWKARALLGIVAAIAIAAIFFFKFLSGAK